MDSRRPQYVLRQMLGWATVMTCSAVLAGVTAGPAVAQSKQTVVQPMDGIEKTEREKTKQSAQNQGKLVKLVVQDSTLDYVLRAIAKQSHRQIVYDNSIAVFSKRVKVRLTEVDVMSALESVLKGTGLVSSRALDGETIILSVGKGTGGVQGKKSAGSILGVVVDSATGKGIARVTVQVLGLKETTLTNDQGRFILTRIQPGEYRLLVRNFGYKSVERLVVVPDSGDVTVRLTLVPMATALSEIVTTATGRQRRVEVGNDITRINADSIMNVAPVATVTDLLTTRVPGLIVMPSSGLPGAPSRLRLRGTSSVSTSNDPIVIIDGVRMFADQSGDKLEGGGVLTNVVGVGNSSSSTRFRNLAGDKYQGPSPIDQLDPNSIEMIEVFKGPSASALYGPDAANGVIVITTKRGRPGPTRVNVAVNAGLSRLPGSWPVNYYRFGHVYQSGPGSIEGGSHLCAPFEQCVIDSLVAFQALNESRFSPLETGMDRGVALDVSGGSAALSYALSGSATTRNGILRLPEIEAGRFRATHNVAAPDWMRQPDHYTTYGGTSKVGMRIGESGNATLTNTVFYSQQQQPPDLGTLIQRMSTMYLDPTQADLPMQAYGYMTRVQFNSLRSTNAMQVGVQPYRWLPLSIQAGLDRYSTDNNTVLPRGYSLPIDGGAVYDEGDSTGVYQVARSTFTTRTLAVSTIVPVPRARVAIGFNYNALSSTSFTARTSNLPLGVLEPTQFIYKEGTGPEQFATSQSTFGWYIAPTLQLTSRLFFNPGLRIDGSSATGTRAGLSTLPKLDFSWLAVDRQDERPLLGVLTQLRPRVAFGVAGVQPRMGNALRLFQTTTAIPVGETTPAAGAVLVNIGNTKLRAERSREFEGGLDGDLWNSRVTFALSGYHKMRYDAIIAFPLSPSAGGKNIAANVGNIRNTGFNAAVDARLLDSRIAEWRVNANVTRNRGMVVSLVEGQKQVVVGGGSGGRGLIVYKPGYPPNAVFVPRISSYFDANNDGRIWKDEIQMADDSAYMGAQEPTYQLDLSTTLSFFHGRVQLSTAVSYQNGLTQYNQIGLGKANSLNDPSIPLGRQAEIVAACGNECGITAATSQIGAYQTVNLLRWNSVSIGYHLPSSIAKRVGGSKMFVALQGSNLGLHSNYRGKDPSVSGYSSGNLVTDSGQLPAPRIVQVRVTWGR